MSNIVRPVSAPALPMIPASIVDAKGDLIAATGADTVARVGVGANGQVLTASSGAATGLTWATPAAAGSGVAGWFNITAYGATAGGTFNNQPAINSAMLAAEAAGGAVFIPAGDFGVNSPVVFRAPVIGLGVDSSQISANPSFVGASVIDNNHTGERKYMRDLRISGGGAAACIGSTDNAGGSPSTLYENVWFTDTPPGVYAVGGTSGGAIAGMLTGAVFLRCSFNGCAQLLDIGINQDDVTLISCRANMDSAAPATDYQINCQGQNTRFIGCYFALGDTDQDYFGIKAFFFIGSSTVSVESTFFEAHNGTNLTHLFALLNPSAHFSARNLVVRNFATTPRTTTLAHILYTNIEAGTEPTFIELENVNYEGDADLTSALSVFIQDGVSGVSKTFKFAGLDQIPAAWTKGSGSTTNAAANFLFLDGTHLGRGYREWVSQTADNELTSVATGMGSATTRYETATNSGVSPRTTTITLPAAGVFWLTVAAKLNGATDHAMTGVWLVMYNDETNDTLLTQAVGTVGKATGSSFGLNTLTASNPTAGGVITLTATFTDGASHAVTWAVRARELAPFGV